MRVSSTERTPATPGREARLLAIVIVVSLVALAVLARFRFPEPERAEVTVRPPNPLERLAARATYDELASVVATLERRVEPVLVVLRLRSVEGGVSRCVPALRVRRGLALARLGPGDRPEALVGGGGAPVLLGLDPLTRLAAIRVTDSPAFAAPDVETGAEGGQARYVAVAEGSPGGIVVRPLFLSRAQPFADPRWSAPLRVLGATPPAQDGSFVFSVEGSLVGMVVAEGGVLALVPSSALLPGVDRLARGSPPPPADIGVEVQELTPELAALSGAASGVVVAHVDPAGPAFGVLQATDVIEEVGGAPMWGTESLRVALAGIGAGTRVDLRVARAGERLDLTVEAPAPHGSGEREGMGLTLRSVPSEGALVLDVVKGSPASLAGIRPGDLVAYLGARPSPTPARVFRAFEELPLEGVLLLGIRRGDGHHVVSLRKP